MGITLYYQTKLFFASTKISKTLKIVGFKHWEHEWKHLDYAGKLNK